MNLHSTRLIVFALLVWGSALGARPAPADDSTVDTNAIEALTPEQAEELAAEFPGVEEQIEIKGIGKHAFSGCLPLNGLTSLDAEAAKRLAAYGPGPLVLNGLKALDVATAEALAAFEGERLFLDGVTVVDADTARALAECKCQGMSLDGLTTLSTDAVEALASYAGAAISLDGLTRLDADSAKAIAGFQGTTLYLNGLTTLDAASAGALAEFRGQLLRLQGLTGLDADSARALVAVERWDGLLSGITAIESSDSVAIAEALATRAGHLSLPNLRKISRKTLLALMEKEDVQVPPIESLEFIPEPDGSLNDDFVIPQWLEQRQRRIR